jgi:alkylation response protein AidB-like acyl-CoA dehydrogenase
VVTDARRIGEAGDGWRVINTCLMHERAIIGTDGAIDLALVPRLVNLARRNGLWEHTHVRDAIVEIYVHAVASAAMTEEFIAAGLDSGEGPGPEMALSKLHLTTNLHRIAEVAHEVLGAAMVTDTGEPDTYGWSDLPLTLPGLRIGGGTDEIMRSIVAQRVLELPH